MSYRLLNSNSKLRNAKGDLSVEQIDFLFVHVPKKSSFYKPLGEFMNITFMPMGIFAMSDYSEQKRLLIADYPSGCRMD